MADRKDDTPLGPMAGLGIYGGPGDRRPRPSRAEKIAAAVSLAWLAAVGLGLLLAARNPESSDAALRFVVILLVVFMPVAVLWVGVAALRSAQVIREEAARLEVAIAALRQAYSRSLKGGEDRSELERKLDQIAAAQRQMERAITLLAPARQAPPASPASDKPAISPGPASAADEPDVQGQLALVAPAETARAEPVSVADFIRALNFPENVDDKEGFQAMRRALRDRATAQLVQAAQDVLTLLSHDGIYMDDLTPDRARPEIWRRFARGERGRGIAALGGIRDRSCLALAAGRMRSDTVFRDSVHHFLRKFDKVFSEFEKTATDADIAALAETRTARAFMLLGRVAGTFD